MPERRGRQVAGPPARLRRPSVNSLRGSRTEAVPSRPPLGRSESARSACSDDSDSSGTSASSAPSGEAIARAVDPTNPWSPVFVRISWAWARNLARRSASPADIATRRWVSSMIISRSQPDIGSSGRRIERVNPGLATSPYCQAYPTGQHWGTPVGPIERSRDRPTRLFRSGNGPDRVDDEKDSPCGRDERGVRHSHTGIMADAPAAWRASMAARGRPGGERSGVGLQGHALATRSRYNGARTSEGMRLQSS